MLQDQSLAVPEGVVTAIREGEWIGVAIGRGKYVKRFNLRDAEARQLLELLAKLTAQ